MVTFNANFDSVNQSDIAYFEWDTFFLCVGQQHGTYIDCHLPT